MLSALITGITGQDGSYLAELLIEQGYRVIGVVRPGSVGPFERIQHLAGRINLVEGSLLDRERLQEIVDQYRPREIYNFAARASSSQLFTEPLLTGEANGLAVVRLLEAIRTVDPSIRFCQASSSEMFGEASESPQNELTPFRPANPYGVAKLFAHGMVVMYRKHFGLFACSAILFNHESPRRGPEFVTRKITMGVARIRAGLADRIKLGSLDARRDWGYASDFVDAMWKMMRADAADDYVIATGESHSVREFCELAFDYVGLDYKIHVELDPRVQRAPETVRRVGDPSKITRVLGWRPRVTFEQLVRLMVDADIKGVTERGRVPAEAQPRQ
jgi:GDPmannose 4,6-dehydratase